MLSFNLFLETLKNSFKYKGRASRFEFWNFSIFSIFYFFILMILSFVFIVLATNYLIFNYDNILILITSVIFFCLMAIPLFLASISLSVRRLHDFDQSGWWLLLSLLPIGFLFLIGVGVIPEIDKDNRYNE